MSRNAKSAPPSGKFRVLLVEDHPVTREGFAQLLNHQTDLEVCGQASTPAQALEMIPSSGPDLAIVDLSLAGGSGMELTKQIRKAHPRLPVLILSTHDESLYAERALRAGARGYVMKLAPTAEVMAAIRQVLGGQIYLSPALGSRVVNRVLSAGKEAPALGVEALTDRELEVFRLIGQGWGTRQIAKDLHLSVSTVETYRSHIKEKLVLPTGGELVRRAVEWVHSQDS